MTVFLVTEGQAEATILGSILRALGISNVSITDAGGKALTTSLARSIALAKRSPVAVVVDSDTHDKSLIRQQSQIFDDLTVGLNRSHECRLFQAVPTLEDELFPAAKYFEQMLSVKLTKAEKAQFDEHKLEFVSNVIKSADEKGKPLILDPRKAMEALDNSHLRELVDFLRGKKHAVSGDYT